MGKVLLLETGKERNAMMKVLEEVSNRGLERLAELVFTELKARGVHYGLDGPYPAWDLKWGFDAVELLAVRGSQGTYTIHPTPNPPVFHYKPSSSGPAGTEPIQSRRV
jgi:hypothetical protein